MRAVVRLLMLSLGAFLISTTNPARAVTVEWVTVGGPGNACDAQSEGCFGSVGKLYKVGRYEVTNDQYAEFLNAVDPAGVNALELYNPLMEYDPIAELLFEFQHGGIVLDSGNDDGAKYEVKEGYGGRPVLYVSFFDALRFANWLSNGQGAASTETGAYTLLGGTALPSNGLTVTRDPAGVVFVASEDEWYKAAYYDGTAASYFDYPAGTNAAIACDLPGPTPNTGNCNGGLNVGTLTDVGSYAGSGSPYGTYDQGGNVWEWNDTIAGSERVLRGGGWANQPLYLGADVRLSFDPATGEFWDVGFRVAWAFPACSNGADDDEDGLVDAEDPGCTDAEDADERPACLLGEEDPDDGNPCTDDSCDPIAGVVNAPNTAPCDDGNACTTGDACNAGSCQPGSPVDVDDGNVCTDDLCDPETGVAHLANAASCDDGSACTTGDVCDAGSCQPGAPVDVDDDNVCTDDLCDPETGVAHVPNTASCDDRDACTLGDVCSEGSCQAVGTVDPDDGNPCTDDSCDAQAGPVHTPNSAPCDDANLCTAGDTCSAGACGGSPVDPDDGDACTLDTCDPGSGVANTPIDTDGDGTPNCSDECPFDPAKQEPGVCGCSVPDDDSDADGTADCLDGCPTDAAKAEPGQCGCFVPDDDADADGTADCVDECDDDPAKIAPQVCGCGVPDADTDGDGTLDCHDVCPADPTKAADPGLCGCGVADTDTDGDGTLDCQEGCPIDAGKTEPGQCGCSVPDVDADGDGTADCNDGCPDDPAKIAPLACGCGAVDTDGDGDGTADCVDECPSDPNKLFAGACGCGVSDADADEDGVPDCLDGCPADGAKAEPGACGCGVADVDTDGDGALDCLELCDEDPSKVAPGQCGCGFLETDTDGDGTADCVDTCPLDPAKAAPGACGCGEPEAPGCGVPACQNGVDDDGDGAVDYPADPGCASALDTSELNAARQCDDGVDNDGDGKLDYRVAPGAGDPGCQSLRSNLERPQCQDGLNNDNAAGIDFDGGASLDLDQNGSIDAQFNPATPPVGAPDPQCVGKPWANKEKAGGCGLGFELVFLAPLLARLARRRRAWELNAELPAQP